MIVQRRSELFNRLFYLLDAEGLCEITRESDAKALLSAFFNRIRGDCDDWRLAVRILFSQLPDTLDATHDWHVNIHEHNVKRV